MSSLELREVTHRYPGTETVSLKAASVLVADGEMVSVVGPSGAGKSTLLRVAAGLERASEGEVLLDGRDVASEPTERRDLTMMFQSPLLFDHLDVAGNVGFAPRLSGAGRREVRDTAERYLRLVHLEGLGRRSVGSLSGGQQQRVALARALAAERGALLLDEPFTSLDRELRTSMHDLLLEVREALAPTILLVTHDLDEAALADSTVVLIDGVVEQQAPMSDLYREPASLATARLLGGFTEVEGTVRDGVHRSLWGAVRLPEECPVDGSAVLLLRQEELRLTSTDEPSAGAGDEAGVEAGVEARVVRRRPVGRRSVLTLSDGDGSRVEVELDAGAEVVPGSPLRVTLPCEAFRWAVSSPVERQSAP